jgi:NAD-dependent deacetylase
MVKTVVPGRDETHLAEAVERFVSAWQPAALTGAGISVESEIPDFRSPGGLWTVMSPEEYATFDVFVNDPQKAWKLYRAIAESVDGAEPNPAHRALADLERAGKLKGVVTQNVDGLHRAAGSENVIEMHGEHQHLQCIKCQGLVEVEREHFTSTEVPRCASCDYPLKPNVVLFGEAVRGFDEIEALLDDCDLLMVIGTSAKVYPAAGLPTMVKARGGLIYEFNTEPTSLTRGETGSGFFEVITGIGDDSTGSDYLFLGKASETMTLFSKHVLDS